MTFNKFRPTTIHGTSSNRNLKNTRARSGTYRQSSSNDISNNVTSHNYSPDYRSVSDKPVDQIVKKNKKINHSWLQNKNSLDYKTYKEFEKDTTSFVKISVNKNNRNDVSNNPSNVDTIKMRIKNSNGTEECKIFKKLPNGWQLENIQGSVNNELFNQTLGIALELKDIKEYMSNNALTYTERHSLSIAAINLQKNLESNLTILSTQNASERSRVFNQVFSDVGWDALKMNNYPVHGSRASYQQSCINIDNNEATIFLTSENQSFLVARAGQESLVGDNKNDLVMNYDKHNQKLAEFASLKRAFLIIASGNTIDYPMYDFNIRISELSDKNLGYRNSEGEISYLSFKQCEEYLSDKVMCDPKIKEIISINNLDPTYVGQVFNEVCCFVVKYSADNEFYKNFNSKCFTNDGKLLLTEVRKFVPWFSGYSDADLFTFITFIKRDIDRLESGYQLTLDDQDDINHSLVDLVISGLSKKETFIENTNKAENLQDYYKFASSMGFSAQSQANSSYRANLEVLDIVKAVAAQQDNIDITKPEYLVKFEKQPSVDYSDNSCMVYVYHLGTGKIVQGYRIMQEIEKQYLPASTSNVTEYVSQRNTNYEIKKKDKEKLTELYYYQKNSSSNQKIIARALFEADRNLRDNDFPITVVLISSKFYNVASQGQDAQSITPVNSDTRAVFKSSNTSSSSESFNSVKNFSDYKEKEVFRSVPNQKFIENYEDKVSNKSGDSSNFGSSSDVSKVLNSVNGTPGYNRVFRSVPNQKLIENYGGKVPNKTNNSSNTDKDKFENNNNIINQNNKGNSNPDDF